MNKHLVKKIIGGIVAALIVVLIYFTYQHHINAPLKGYKIHLNDDEVYSFLQKEDIEKLFVEDRNIDIQKLSIKTINLEEMETVILSNPWVEKAEIYIDNTKHLNIAVVQRIPIARVFDINNSSYYLDSTLSIMPTIVGFSYPVVVFTDVPAIKNTQQQNDIYKNILTIAKFINNDTFWSKQVVQVSMIPKNKFVMATLLGNQKIIIGDTTALATKFSNLMAFYKQVNNTLGWDKYDELNLSFINQVVASPTLGWIPPRSADTIVQLPDVIDEKELLQTLPAQPTVE
jgi:cell division protein FtsQ